MENKTIDNFFINFSLLLITFIMIARTYIFRFTNSNTLSLAFLLLAILFLFLVIIKNKKMNRQKFLFLILCIFILLPFFYKNAYFQDKKYIGALYYIFAIFYSILFSFSSATKKNFEFLLKLLILFSFITSFVTWISFINPNFYIAKFIPLLPVEYRNSVIKMFLYHNAYAGLTDNYSRNAFFVVLGVFGEMYFFRKEQKRNIVYILFFLLTLFLIGKRGHLLFLILSFIILYFVYNNVGIKSILKFSIIIVLSALFLLLSINNIPGISNVIDRTENSNGDISTGRFELYEKAIYFYKNNGDKPIGWNQFSKKTNYTFVGVHNDYLQIFVETGIFGFFLIVGSNIYILKKAILYLKRTKNKLSCVVLIYNLFFLLYSLTGTPHYGFENYMIYFIFNAFLFIEIYKINQNRRLL